MPSTARCSSSAALTARLVAHELVDTPAVALDHLHRLVPDARHDGLDLFRIEGLVQGGVTREVGEHDGGMAPFALVVQRTGQHRASSRCRWPGQWIRCTGGRVCGQAGRCPEQPLAVTQRHHAKFPQVGVGELGQQVRGYVLCDKRVGVLAEAEGGQPGPQVLRQTWDGRICMRTVDRHHDGSWHREDSMVPLSLHPAIVPLTEQLGSCIIFSKDKPMENSSLTSRQLYAAVKANPTRKRFGFGRKPALINIDLQKAYTCVGEFATAYETDPRQLEYVNALAAEFRARGFPVVWTYVAYMASGEDAGVWGTRTNTPDSLQNIKVGSRRAEFDDRLVIDRQRDIIINKRMASAFFETNLGSIFTFHGVDTVVVTGGSTSGCVRATAVDSLQRSFRTIVPEECVADKHEGPHFANLYDMALKYADVLSIEETMAQLRQVAPAAGAGQ
jgi:maleamate amidohydrolase